jgi:hypothetical protein
MVLKGASGISSPFKSIMTAFFELGLPCVGLTSNTSVVPSFTSGMPVFLLSDSNMVINLGFTTSLLSVWRLIRLLIKELMLV